MVAEHKLYRMHLAFYAAGSDARGSAEQDESALQCAPEPRFGADRGDRRSDRSRQLSIESADGLRPDPRSAGPARAPHVHPAHREPRADLRPFARHRQSRLHVLQPRCRVAVVRSLESERSEEERTSAALGSDRRGQVRDARRALVSGHGARSSAPLHRRSRQLLWSHGGATSSSTGSRSTRSR